MAKKRQFYGWETAEAKKGSLTVHVYIRVYMDLTVAPRELGYR